MIARRAAGALLGALFLVGCAAPAQRFDRGANTEAQYVRDGAECEMRGEQSRTTHGFGGIAGVAWYFDSFDKVFDACMRSKGYARAAP